MAKQVTLDEQVAYLLRTPIRTPEDMPTPVTTAPIDAEWDANISDLWWHHKNGIEDFMSAFHNPLLPQDYVQKLELIGNLMIQMRSKLLAFGGHNVCMPGIEEDVAAILKRGQFWYGDRIHMMKGQPCQCHRNSAYCWWNNKDKTVICTGYALSEDGMWRQHSWLVELRPRKNRIVETTVPRVAYFGFAMTEEEATNFYFDNE